MFNLFDILQAQAGSGALGFGQQFGLSQEQSRRAMEALLPAFTMGLQRNAANDPTGFAHLFNFLGPGAPGYGAAPATPQMEMLVRQLFGSSHLSQAVLQQAASTSGVASPILKQMLPLMAGMIVTGIVHVMINQKPAPAPAPQPSPFGFPGQAWAEMMQGFLGSAAGAPKAPAATGRSAAAPPSLTLRPGARVTDSKPPQKPADLPVDLFQQMFQTGLEVQQENVRAMQALFDTFWQDQTKPHAPVDPKAPKTRTGGSTS